MLFTQLEFPIFLVLVLLIAWACRTRITRNAVLLVASYYFYAYWDYRFCGLLLFSTLVDYALGGAINRSDDDRVRRMLVTVSVVVNFGLLGFFKYCNFFIDSARLLFESVGLGTQTLEILLPVGISFYTFQTLSYTIDIYRRRIPPSRNLLDFALYVAFFPQLVAGPIVRASELMPQLQVVPSFSKRRFYGGAQLLLRGAVKKVLLADRLGEMVDIVYAGPDLYSGATIGVAIIAYTIQIYYDFSGYTDMAIGAAKMLGYRFPANFRHPYLATSVANFWHRWHMTLSRWLRDYLYISIGGSRGGAVMTYRNLMITMTLGGLWHGAAWTFVSWGAWHGLCLCIARAWPYRMPRWMGWVLTMVVVMVGLAVFRSADIAMAGSVLGRVVLFSPGIAWFPPLALIALGLSVADHLAWKTRLRRAMRLPYDAWYSPVATAMMIWSLALYAPRGFRPFVYFQF